MALPRNIPDDPAREHSRCPRCGRVLSDQELADLAAELRERHLLLTGRKRTCVCGDCPKCRMRMYQADRRRKKRQAGSVSSSG